MENIRLVYNYIRTNLRRFALTDEEERILSQDIFTADEQFLYDIYLERKYMRYIQLFDILLSNIEIVYEEYTERPFKRRRLY